RSSALRRKVAGGNGYAIRLRLTFRRSDRRRAHPTGLIHQSRLNSFRTISSWTHVWHSDARRRSHSRPQSPIRAGEFRAVVASRLEPLFDRLDTSAQDNGGVYEIIS